MRSLLNADPQQRPEIGTAEAAVASCVSLIAGICEQREEVMAYWLDLYYQARLAWEWEKGANANT